MWMQLGVIIISAFGQMAATGALALAYAGKRAPAPLYAALVRIEELAKLFRYFPRDGHTYCYGYWKYPRHCGEWLFLSMFLET